MTSVRANTFFLHKCFSVGKEKSSHVTFWFHKYRLSCCKNNFSKKLPVLYFHHYLFNVFRGGGDIIIKIVLSLPVQCVDLCNINVIQLLHCCTNLGLVGALVNDENKCVVVLNLLHGRFSCQRKLHNAELVQPCNKENEVAKYGLVFLTCFFKETKILNCDIS